MEYFLIITTIIFATYIFTISYFYFGWEKEPIYKSIYKPSTPLSVIIPFRNENQNLPKIFKALQQQTLPPYLFEIIFVNDHSTDSSVKTLNKLIPTNQEITLLHTFEKGKKQAIKKAVEHCKYNYFVTIDADCIPDKNWLYHISSYLQDNESDLLVGSVSFIKKESWFSRFQHYEFMSLIISGAGAIFKHKPIMCNGANLTISKELYSKAQKAILNKYASGDDIFLLQYATKHNYKINFLKTKESNVYTHSTDSLRDFFHQRIRWASKSKGYKDLFTIMVAIIVFAICLIEISFPIILFFNTSLSLLISLGILLKGFVDYKMIKAGSNFMGEKLTFLDYLSFSAAYPIYIVSTSFLSFFIKTSWKERKV